MTDDLFRYSDLLPLGADETPYRLLTTAGVSAVEANGRTAFLLSSGAALEATSDTAGNIAATVGHFHLDLLAVDRASS